MKLSEAPNCAKCDKKLLHTQTPICFKIETTPLLLDAIAARQVEGMNMMRGGNLNIAEAFVPSADVLKEQPEHATTEYFCTHCAARITEVASKE